MPIRPRRAWDRFEGRLTEVVERLQHREFVVLSDQTEPDRYVQVMRGGAVLTAECCGPVVDGGPATLAPATQAALLDLGWPPVDPADGYPNYRDHWITQSDLHEAWRDGLSAGEVASRLVQSLRVLGVLSPDHLHIERFTKPDPFLSALPTPHEVAEVAEGIAERRGRRTPSWNRSTSQSG